MCKLILFNKRNRRTVISLLLTAVMLITPFLISGVILNALASSADNGLIYFEENFNSIANGKINGKNNWISQYAGTTPASSHQVKSKYLLAEDFSDCNGVCTSITERPMSEAAINQRISVDVLNLSALNNHASANVHLRVIHGQHNKKSDIGYYAEVTAEYIKIKKINADWTVSDLSGGGNNTYYNCAKNHIYRVEFSAYGLCPTTLSATLYDVTDGNKEVAKVTGSDDTEALQRTGTVALSCTRNAAGQNVAMFDNFKYEQIDKPVAYDNFNRANGSVGNGWVNGKMAVTKIDGKVLKLKMSSVSAPYNPHIEDSAVMRPMSEASLDQLIELEFKRPDSWADIGGVIIARAQSETVTANNCYRLITHFAFDGANNWTEFIYLVNSKGTELFKEKLDINPDTKCRLQLLVNSISETETLLVASLYDSDTDDLIYQNKVIDDDPALQKAGTAGLSLLDRWNGELNIFKFSYFTPPKIDYAQIYPADDEVPVYFEDNFDDESGVLHSTNGWVDQLYLNEKKNFATVSDKKLILDNGEVHSTGVYDYKLLRTFSQACLNQEVSVDLLNLDDISFAEVALRIIETPSNFDKIAAQAFYGLIVEKGHMVFCTHIAWGQGEIAGLDYEYEKGHIYRVTASAQGTKPTVLVANLYDLTDGGKLVATLTARDSTLSTSDHRSAQNGGTVGLSYCGTAPAEFDNFVYTQLDTKICHDSFNRKNGAVGNDWVIGSGAQKTAINSVELQMNNNGVNNMWLSSMMRPETEKSTEQYVSIEYLNQSSGGYSASPILFARAQTGKTVSVDGSDGFACYYAKLTYTGEWSARLSVYKVTSEGKTVLLGEKDTDIYGRLSKTNTRIILLAQGSGTTKLDAVLNVIEDEKIYDILNFSVEDSQAELQCEGTAGISYADSFSKFAVKKFSYLKPAPLPEKNPVPEDLDGEYMAYFTGTVAAGNFFQWVELERDKEYIYSVRLKKVLDSGGFGIRVQYNPVNRGHIYMEYPYESITIDENTFLHTVVFKVPSDAHVLPNGKSRIQITVHEGGLSSTGYATDFKVYAKDDPKQTNLLVNPDFKKGFYGWGGHGYYVQGTEEGGILQTQGDGEVLLVPYDELAFVRDDSDVYFDDGNWACIYEEEDVVTVKKGVIRGHLYDSDNNPMSDVTVSLFPTSDTVTTDKNGAYEFKNLEPEYYYVSVKGEDGNEYEFDEVLIIDEGTELNVTLTYDGGNSSVDTDAEKDISKKETAKKDNKTSVKSENPDGFWIWIIIIASVSVVLVLAFVIFFTAEKKKRNTK